MLPVYIRNDLLPQALTLLEPYQRLDLSVPGYRERTTAAEILIGAAAQEVIHARARYPNHTFSNDHYPLETITTVRAYLKALRTSAVSEFNKRLETIADPALRSTHILCMNARVCFVEPEEALKMVTTDLVLKHIALVESYD